MTKSDIYDCVTIGCWQGPMMKLERDAIISWNEFMGRPLPVDDVEGVAV